MSYMMDFEDAAKISADDMVVHYDNGNLGLVIDPKVGLQASMQGINAAIKREWSLHKAKGRTGSLAVPVNGPCSMSTRKSKPVCLFSS